jgi:sulfite reductase (NADPH) flavoprotein alpha-component
MLRNVLFQTHWLVGVTLGTLLAFSGLTGGMMAFGPELSDFFSGANVPVDTQSGGALDVATLYAKLHRAQPEKTISSLSIYDDPRKPVRVVFAAARGPIGPLGPQPEAQLVNPYTGALLPVKPVGKAIARFMLWLRDVHQGHWSGPGTVSKIAATVIGLATVLLMAMTLTGLYLRWPRGIAATNWRSWFKINPRLKGRAFLWNLHAVFGTFALLVLLVSAHSGAFQNGEMSWYGNGVRAMVGLPARAEGGPGGGPMGPMGGLPRGSQGLTIHYMSSDSYVDADTEVINARSASFDPATGEITAIATKPLPKSLGEKLAANNQLIHEGRIFGKGGTLVIMLAALCLPVFYITGWMMYLDRRRAKRATWMMYLDRRRAKRATQGLHTR